MGYFLFALFSYALALFSQLWFILYLTDVDFMTTIYSEQSIERSSALTIDFLLLTLFALQHSIMARKSFKKRILKIIPAELERAFYTLASGVAFILICYLFEPIDGVVWSIEEPLFRESLWIGFVFGWSLSIYATFIIDHFELFGVKQPYYLLKNRELEEIEFKERSLYRVIRHPIQFGVLLGLWITPEMTLGHLFLSAVLTLYILIGLYFEERNLVREFGDIYLNYRERVGMLFPKIRI